MAGSRRRHRRRSRPPQAEPSPLEPPTTPNPRKVAVAERPSKKTCHASGSTSSTSSGPHVWADLLDSLLHQIIALLSSFHDLLAFTGTCRSWRTALSSFPSVYTLAIPPLHLKPQPYTHPRYNHVRHMLLSNYRWKLGDPAKRTLSLCCSASQNNPKRMRYLGCSYGYLIFSYREHCLLVDVYTGTKVKPPKLWSNSNIEIYYGILMAPLSSPNSHLLLCSRSSMFQWQIGTNSWLEHPLGGERILQIVFFKGEIFVMDFLHRLHTIRLVPQLNMLEVAVVWGDEMVVGLHFKPWLVVCGDMLLMVDISVCIDLLSGFSYSFQAFRLDFSVEPAKWVKMEKLGNWALFVGLDRRNPTFSCMSPERWGGKSNFIYVASASEDSDEPWSAVELGQPTARGISYTARSFSYSVAAAHLAEPNGHCSQLDCLWVLPSLIYGVGQ